MNWIITTNHATQYAMSWKFGGKCGGCGEKSVLTLSDPAICGIHSEVGNTLLLCTI